MTRRKPRGLRPDEKELWEKVRQNTVPISAQTNRNAVVETVNKIDGPKIPTPIAQFEVGSGARSKTTEKVRPSAASGVGVAMDAKRFGQMKKGKLAPEARIDLHGMNLAQAHPALVGFILRSHQQGHRLVLVITGKGKAQGAYSPNPTRSGIIKRQVPHWLTDSMLRPLVLQVAQAHARHGGGGAIYVYLRRSR